MILINIVTNALALETAGSLPYIKEPTTGPYPELTGSTLHPQPITLTSIVIPSSHLRLGLPCGLFPFQLTYSYNNNNDVLQPIVLVSIVSSHIY
jgi:hypothetical protein